MYPLIHFLVHWIQVLYLFLFCDGALRAGYRPPCARRSSGLIRPAGRASDRSGAGGTLHGGLHTDVPDPHAVLDQRPGGPGRRLRLLRFARGRNGRIAGNSWRNRAGRRVHETSRRSRGGVPGVQRQPARIRRGRSGAGRPRWVGDVCPGIRGGSSTEKRAAQRSLRPALRDPIFLILVFRNQRLRPTAGSSSATHETPRQAAGASVRTRRSPSGSRACRPRRGACPRSCSRRPSRTAAAP